MPATCLTQCLRNQDAAFRNFFARRTPGLALAGAIAFAGIELGQFGWLQSHGISALTIAILLGMVMGNTVYAHVAPRSAPGVAFAKQNVLRLGIILYGLRLTFQDIGHVGFAGVVTDALVVCSTFSLACWLGVRLFGLGRGTAMLIGAGSSICGAAAVMAAEPVVRGRAEQVTVAVSTVVAFGTVAIFLYPALYHLNSHYQLLRLSPGSYGLFAGSTIHEVAQVVAAGRAIGEQAANTAVIAKMVRVMMLAPFLIILSAYISRSMRAAHAHSPGVAIDAASTPLIREFFHVCRRSIAPVEVKDPPDDHTITVHEHRTDTGRLYRLGTRQNLTLVRHVGISANSWGRLVLLHGGVFRVELLASVCVCVLFDQRYETLERFRRGHRADPTAM